MKRMIAGAVLAMACGAQAEYLTWASTVVGGEGHDFAVAANWFDGGGAASAIPGAGDVVQIGDLFGNPIADWPTVDSVVSASPDALIVGHFADGTLNIVDGGRFAVPGLVRLGNADGFTGTVNMSGGQLISGTLEFGAGGSMGILKMSHDAAALTDNLLFTGAGAVYLSDDAIFAVNGDTSGMGYENSWILSSVAGRPISVFYNKGLNQTAYTVSSKPAKPGQVSWRDDFGLVPCVNWTAYTHVGSVAQINGQMVLDTGVAGSTAQAAVNTLSDETDTLTHIDGARLYNFNAHRVSARFDIASMTGAPDGANNRNVFYFCIGDDVEGNFVPQSMDDGLGIALEQLDIGNGAFFRLVVSSMSGGVETLVSLANLSGVPSALSYTLDGTEVLIEVEGATFTGSGWLIANDGTTLSGTVGNLSANMHDYNLAFGAHNLGTVSAKTEVALESLSIAIATASVGGPVAVENGRFVVKETGAPFFPMGFNYIDLRMDDQGHDYHDTFNPSRYDSLTVSSILSEIAEGGFNTVRVFTDVAMSSNSVVSAWEDTELAPAYMQCVADFLEQAHAQGLYVVLTFSLHPATERYLSLFDTLENVAGMNAAYMNPGYIAAKRLYLRDFIQALSQLAPERMKDTVLAIDPQNEVAHYVDHTPFVLSSGTVTPANGKTYDLASDKVQLSDEMAVYWVDEMAEEIRLQVPGVLVDINVYTHFAVGRSIGDFQMYGTTNAYDWRDRYPFCPEALAQSAADFCDLHIYTADAANLLEELESIEFSAVSSAWNAAGKPIIVGEFGAFKELLSLDESVPWKREELEIFKEIGFQGWLYWTYQCDAQDNMWHAADGDGAIFDMLKQCIWDD